MKKENVLVVRVFSPRELAHKAALNEVLNFFGFFMAGILSAVAGWIIVALAVWILLPSSAANVVYGLFVSLSSFCLLRCHYQYVFESRLRRYLLPGDELERAHQEISEAVDSRFGVLLSERRNRMEVLDTVVHHKGALGDICEAAKREYADEEKRLTEIEQEHQKVQLIVSQIQARALAEQAGMKNVPAGYQDLVPFIQEEFHSALARLGVDETLEIESRDAPILLPLLKQKLLE